jgi:predicted NBD/HSP70 family sugar kinase
VLRVVRTDAAVTVAEAAARTGLSRPTVEVALTDLAGLGLVEALAPAPGERRMGRPARSYRFRPEAGYVLGLDIGLHKVLAAVADLDGRVLATHRIEVGSQTLRKDRLATVRAAAKACLAAAGITRDRLWAAAAGTVGIVEPGGRVRLSSVIPEWTGLNLARELGRSFPCPVTVENDANLAAVAERWLGEARDVNEVVYLLAGMRMGAGVLSGGTLQRGHTGAAGEIGALAALGWQDAPRQLVDDPGTDFPEQVVAALIASARNGDRDAQARIARFVDGIALGTATMALAFDPELLVVGGGFARTGDLTVAMLQKHLNALCVSPPRVTSSSLGEESVALGALRTALDVVESRLTDTGSGG